MKRSLMTIFLASIIGVSGITFAQQPSFKVVGNSDSTPVTMSKRDLARIFLKRESSWPSGRTAVPVDQIGNNALRESFAERVLDRSLVSVESYWQAQVFSGKESPPKGLRSDTEVIAFVSKMPGAVGYVSANAPTEGVTVISISD